MKEGNIPRPRPAAYTWRAATATVRAFTRGISAEQAARSLWPEDDVTPIILRGTSTQATLTDPAWAGPLAHLSVLDAIQEAVALSAIGKLLDDGGAFRVDLGRLASLRVPGRLTSAADAGQWVAEGGAIPVRQLNFLGPVLGPHKLACIVTMTREMAEASNIEDMVRVLLAEAAGLALDAAVLSNFAGDATRSAGIFHNITPLTAAAGGSTFENVGEDLGALVADLASRAGGAGVVFIGAPAQAVAMRYYAGGQFGRSSGQDIPVYAAASMAPKTIAAIEPSSLAITLRDPTFEVSTATALHQEDTTPVINLPTGTPVKSMFQIDALALKMTMWADWGMRAPHVAFISSTAW
jgi:hypothetical protein